MKVARQAFTCIVYANVNSLLCIAIILNESKGKVNVKIFQNKDFSYCESLIGVTKIICVSRGFPAGRVWLVKSSNSCCPSRGSSSQYLGGK